MIDKPAAPNRSVRRALFVLAAAQTRYSAATSYRLSTPMDSPMSPRAIIYHGSISHTLPHPARRVGAFCVCGLTAQPPNILNI